MPVRLRGELAISPAGTLHPAGVMSTLDTAIWFFPTSFLYGSWNASWRSLLSAHPAGNISLFPGRLFPRFEGALRHAEQFKHLALQIGHLRMEDLNDLSSLHQNVPLDMPEKS